MAELTNESYHYKSKLSRRISDDDEDNGLLDSSGKKKQRRKKRMLTGISKQRRAANERERKRLHIINLAYQDLKSVLPLHPGEINTITKTEVVRLASKTIRYLADLLSEVPENYMHTRSPLGSESTDCSNSSDDTTSESSNDANNLFSIDNIEVSPFMNGLNDLNNNALLENSAIYDGFEGLDISSFLREKDATENIYPSMLQV